VASVVEGCGAVLREVQSEPLHEAIRRLRDAAGRLGGAVAKGDWTAGSSAFSWGGAMAGYADPVGTERF